MAALPRKVSAVPGGRGKQCGRRRAERRGYMWDVPRAAAASSSSRGSNRGGNDGQAPPRPGRDGSPRAGRRAGEGRSLLKRSPQAGRAGLGRLPPGGQSGKGPLPSAAGQVPPVCWQIPAPRGEGRGRAGSGDPPRRQQLCVSEVG